MGLTEISGCLHGDLHWFSQQILDYYLSGKIPTGDFLRWFHMPNSSYLASGQCIADIMDPDYDYRLFRPGLMDGYLPSCKQGPYCS